MRYVETDAQTIVYHSNYLVYCDTARVEWVRAFAGGGTPWRESRDYDVVLAHASLDWKASAKFDDPLTVWMRLDNIGTSSFTFVYRIERQGTLLCEAKTVHVAIDRAARTKRALPDSFKERLRHFAETLG
ncbi:MAG TPA: thioesterase family protein [Polyangia bacterium]